jgi:diaminohydroxyphosphoribosylaminopyrimidine deaminase/5-amino-6-(5-phosphoribosylamino)uracil reductase
MAATLDGQAGAVDGGSQWITSEEARSDVHGLRAHTDAVLVGAGTVLLDDPRLTARGPDAPTDRPLAVIIAGERPLDPSAQVFSRPCLVYAPTPLDLPATVIDLPGTNGVDLAEVLVDLGDRGVVDLLVEGGPTIAGSLLRQGLVDRIVWYVGAAVAGGVGRPAVGGLFPSMDALRPVEIVAVDRVGPDVRIEALVGAS